jgi:CIC family chloride channel protein
VTNVGNPIETDAEPGKRKSGSSESGKSWDVLGDFTATTRLLPISGLALAIGVVAAFIALALLRLIGLFTNLFYFGRWSTALVSPSGNHLGIFAVLVPVGGALIIGLMARYGSERIRGHGIPEAIEAILINGSRVEPKVALLKPISSAISIGSGGPFGAEGPIIMTGGAIGSMIAQLFHLTSAERKTLLVAGAAAGMSATFAAPVASVLLAVELLLFEWKPRSLVPVALASAMAAVLRRYLLGFGPLFPVPEHPIFIGPKGLLGCVLVGLLAGVLSALLTISVYAAEDAFQRLPNSLDVVAHDWRAGDWLGRIDFSAGAGRGIRHHRRIAARQRDDARDTWRVDGEMVHLGGIAWLGDIRRRFGAVADDGWSTWRP